MVEPRRDQIPDAPPPGSVVVLDRDTTPQLAGQDPIYMRVTRVEPGGQDPTWAWLHGYQLDSTGHAIERREIYVRLAGIRRVDQGFAVGAQR